MVSTSAFHTFITNDSASLIERYYRLLSAFAKHLSWEAGKQFEPSMDLPILDEKMAAFLAPATASYDYLSTYNSLPLYMLDLRQNPHTHTTKTFASLVIVARAIAHIQKTDESIIIVSPSSGNKAIALRDAVERALAVGLVEADQLRIITLTPEQTRAKLRRSALTDDPMLAALNPVFVLNTTTPEAVKVVGRDFLQALETSLPKRVRVWYSLRLENYLVADVLRAFYDYEFGNASQIHHRTAHVHAVSSAYGLLGYNRGIEFLNHLGIETSSPAFLLVQHLSTCDMVLHWLFRSFSRENLPAYHFNEDTGIFSQASSQYFPAHTWSPEEILEHTFYTHEPPTAVEMSHLIDTKGGGGIVVSLFECLNRYAQCRLLLGKARINVPADPRSLREWSLIMALTGALNAIDRGILDPNIDALTIHASGLSSADDYLPIAEHQVIRVNTAADMMASMQETQHSREA